MLPPLPSSDVVGEGHRAVEVEARGDGEGAVAVVGDGAVGGGEVGDGEGIAIDIGEAGQQVGGADGVGGVLGAGGQRRGGRAGGRVVDGRDGVALHTRYAAAVPVEHVVGEGHRAVEVQRRRDGEGAVAVVGDAAVGGGEVGDREGVAVDVGESGQQVGGADGVGGVLGAGGQHRGGGAGRRVVDGRDGIALGTPATLPPLPSSTS